MTVLVLGGTGFLGAAVAAAFERRGADVVCLSRSGGAPAGRGVTGDVRLPDLGLAPAAAAELRAEVTHVVSCFGSVDWRTGPRLAELHEAGTRNALAFARSCGRLERFAHVSSVLALGRARGAVSNRELDVGQSFRNWYECAKFLAERAVREEREAPWRVVRLGPVLGVGVSGAPSAAEGILAVLPPLLRGYPVHLADHGEWPCYPCEVGAAAEVVVRAATDPDDAGEAWTYWDERDQTLAQALVALCAGWGVMPRIVSLRPLRVAALALARPLGVPESLLGYDEPWVELDAGARDDLPDDLPACPGGYLEETGAALRAGAGELLAR